MDAIVFNPEFFVRWLHVLAGILWIGLLWYFNFVQIPTMPKIPDEFKKGVSGYIAPRALLYFRHAAIATVLFGLILSMQMGYFKEAMTLGVGQGNNNVTLIGIGMWLGLIMAFNVWVFIWPNQQIALGLKEAPADAKPKAARTAMLFSRTNFMLSFPMLYAMVGAQNS
jgi:uncharacterized membrane protein